MSDEDVTERELREAEALACALERGSASDDLPEEALQAAALIRYSAGGGVLREDRAQAVLEEVLAAAERVRERNERGARREPAPLWRWLLGAIGLTAAAVLVLVIVAAPGDPAPTALPAPGAELLRAQLARLDDRSADARFERAMASYRGEVYAALEARYGGR